MDNSGGLYNSDDSNQYSDDDDDGVFSLRNAVVDELGSDLKKSLKVDSYDKKYRNMYNEEEEDEEEEDEDLTEALLVQMGYGKTKTKTGAAKPPGEEEEEEEDGDITEDLLNQMGYEKTEPPKHEPPATPIPAENLKSAMKGSKKKEELPDKERKVTWAEDVYDSIPSAASHFATNRIGRNRSDNQKRGKNRQKWGGKGAGGGASGGRGTKDGKDKDRVGKDKEKKQGGGGGGAKGGKDKDKKQVKKFCSSSTRKCFDTLDEARHFG